MNKIITLLLICTGTFLARGQDNSFPASGRVGIGTTDPHYLLDVRGTLNASQILLNGAPLPKSAWQLSGANTFYQNGKVGIGTNTPQFDLDIAGTMNASQILLNGAPLPKSAWQLSGANTFYQNGKVGIGTNTPQFDLDIAGTMNASRILLNGAPLPNTVWELSGTNTFYQNGKVGIGTNTPQFDLDIVGTVNASRILIEGAPLPSSPWTLTGTDVVYKEGRVGIGVSHVPVEFSLAVAGPMIAEGVTVKLKRQGWPDYVFMADYKLPTLYEVEDYIQTHGHLKNIPNAQEVGENGVELGDISTKLLQKIEELMLYTIQQQKEIDQLKAINAKFLEDSEQ